MAQPLHTLTRIYSNFQGAEKCHKTFEQVNRRPTVVVALSHCLICGDLILDMDASDFINTVLSQIQNNEKQDLAYSRCSMPQVE